MATKEWMAANRDKMRAYRRKYYHDNKETEKARITKRKQELQKWFHEYKKTLRCEECGESHVGCLDFHHKDRSEKEICLSGVIQQGWCKERIMKEVEKCIVLCSNCHRKLHYEEKSQI